MLTLLFIVEIYDPQTKSDYQFDYLTLKGGLSPVERALSIILLLRGQNEACNWYDVNAFADEPWIDGQVGPLRSGDFTNSPRLHWLSFS